MNRRTFLKNSLSVSLAVVMSPQLIASSKKVSGRYIMTVDGKIDAGDFGLILPHEHVMSNFGQEPSYIGQYNTSGLMQQVVPYLKKVKGLGCDALVECTTAYFGRNVQLLKEISSASGLTIITNTGWYAAANDRYVPDKAYRLTADEIAQIWIDEWRDGIDDTEVKPGFIKLAVDDGPVSAIDKKLVRAGAKTHRKTGLVMQVHTSNNPKAATLQLETIKNEGVHPSAWIWTHAHNVPEPTPLIEAAKEGAWISLDGIRADTKRQDHIFMLLKALAAKGYQRQILLSHDGDAYPSGRKIRPFHALMTEFLPRLKSEGFTEQDLIQFTTLNPQDAFSVHVRKV